jgi:hypothetical protein
VFEIQAGHLVYRRCVFGCAEKKLVDVHGSVIWATTILSVAILGASWHLVVLVQSWVVAINMQKKLHVRLFRLRYLEVS